MGSLMNTVYASSAEYADHFPVGPFELPGFVENGVTHKAFSFVLRFRGPEKPHRPLNETDNCVSRFRHAHVTERNGAGTFHYHLNGEIVDAIHRLANDDPRLCFHVVRGLRYAHTESHNEGRAEGIHYLGRAAAQGRLKVRKVRGREAAKVSVMHPHIPSYAEWDATYGTAPPEPSADGSVRVGCIQIGGGTS